MRPHLELAEATDVTIAIENHAASLIESPDSMKWLVELRPSPRLAVALAPYHLPQRESMLSNLIHSLGTDGIAVFYAWQHGMGCMEKLPKEQELLQLPGCGSLDFVPLLRALREIRYTGWTEIFMHPFPRGIPVHETMSETTAEICRSARLPSELPPSHQKVNGTHAQDRLRFGAQNVVDHATDHRRPAGVGGLSRHRFGQHGARLVVSGR